MDMIDDDGIAHFQDNLDGNLPENFKFPDGIGMENLTENMLNNREHGQQMQNLDKKKLQEFEIGNHLDGNDNRGDENENQIDENDNQIEDNDNQMEDNDSNSDNRFPEVNEGGWINWFCSLEDNDYFVEIDEDFIKNKANLIGIKCQEYLNTLLSPDAPNEESLNDDSLENLQNIKEIYGLIHKRFITTPKGLALMREKYLNGDYGYCPRVLCHKQVLLPIGLSDDTKYSRVKVFCPFCEEVYAPYKHRKKPVDIDGAFFGSSFPHIFLMTYTDLNPKNKKFLSYIPKVYGFRVFGKKGSKYYSEKKEDVVKTKKKLGIELEGSDEEYLDDSN